MASHSGKYLSSTYLVPSHPDLLECIVEQSRLCLVDRVYASFKDALMEVIKERFDRFGNLRAVIA